MRGRPEGGLDSERGPIVLVLGAVFVFGAIALVSLTGLGAETVDPSGLCAGPDL